MRTRATHGCTLLLASLAALTWSASSAAQCQYSVMQWAQWVCDWDGNRTYTGTGLNDLGAWCGYRSMCWPEEGDGWLPVYCPPGGQPQVLPIPVGADTDGARALGLNSAGVVVGWFRRPPYNLDTACVWWPNGTITVLPQPPNLNRSSAYAINESNTVVGTMFFDPDGSAPFMWKDGELSLIDVGDFGYGTAIAISNSGVVAGMLGTDSTNGRAYRWKDGRLTILEPIGGHQISLARGMNEQGWVVGESRSFIPGQGIVQMPTIWKEYQGEMLPYPPGYVSGATGRINNAGVVTGAFASAGSGFPFVNVVWIANEVHPINTLLVPGSPSLGTLVAINEAGQILSSGGPRLATPISVLSTDLNGDCSVDGDDLGVLLSSWGVPDFDPRCDFNGDGAVDGFDLGTLLGEWTAVK